MQTYKHICFKKFALTIAYFSLSNFITICYAFLSRPYLTTASDGKEYNVTFYSLDMILAIGFRVRSKRGTQFRIWANKNLKEYMVKGFVMDNERLKNPDGRPDYFDELLKVTKY